MVQLAEAAEVAPQTVGENVAELLDFGGWTLKPVGTTMDRYPEWLKRDVLRMAGDLLRVGFRRRTVVLVLTDICQGRVRCATLHNWVYNVQSPRPTSPRTSA